MTIWTGIGINYGHQVSGSSYNTTQVEADFTYLRAIGISRIRIAFPAYNDSSGLIANCQDMVSRALSHGFYVVWGVSSGVGNGALTATIWTALKAYVISTQATYAQSSGLSEFCLANEPDLEADGSTLTATTVRSDVRAMCVTVKTGGYTGNVSFSTSILDAIRNPWVSEGIGTLDYIGWNSYDTPGNFNKRNGTIFTAFGTKAYVSEFGGITHGWTDFNNEDLYYIDTAYRIGSMRTGGITAGYFFTYRTGGGFGLGEGTFELLKSDGTIHTAREAVRGRRIAIVNSASITRTVVGSRTAY